MVRRQHLEKLEVPFERRSRLSSWRGLRFLDFFFYPNLNGPFSPQMVDRGGGLSDGVSRLHARIVSFQPIIYYFHTIFFISPLFGLPLPLFQDETCFSFALNLFDEPL